MKNGARRTRHCIDKLKNFFHINIAITLDRVGGKADDWQSLRNTFYDVYSLLSPVLPQTVMSGTQHNLIV